MKSISALLSLCWLLLLPIYGKTSTSFPDESYHRKNFTLTLDQSGKFTSSDSVLTSLTSGSWTLKDKKLTLSQKVNDSLEVSEQLYVSYISDNKLSLSKDGNRFSFHDAESSSVSSGLSIMSILRGILGLMILFGIAFLFSKNRNKIDWKLVGKGTILQVVLAILILKVPMVSDIFDFLAKAFARVIEFAHDGAMFLFGTGDSMPSMMKNFAFWILPSVVFFSALSSLLYYFGILQFVVKGMAWVMKRVLGISGAESVAAAANIFIGQTEAPLLVKPYLSRMTKSEILCLMVGGMATIAGGVLAAVIGILGEGDSAKELFYAKHLLTASIMSAPAAIVFAKILVPETEEIDTNLEVSKEKIGVNALEAITNGTTDGLKLAVNVGAMLIVFISLVAFANYFLGKVGEWTSLNEVIASGGMYPGLSFESISGYILSPFSFSVQSFRTG